MSNQDNIQAAIDAGKTIGAYTPRVVETPDGQYEELRIDANQQIVSLENYRTTPRRKEITVALDTIPSLKEYLERFAQVETVIFAHRDSATIEAIIDYHEAADRDPSNIVDRDDGLLELDTIPDESAANWLRHRARVKLNLSRQYSAWQAADGREFSQEDFAYFLEENELDIRDPESARLLEIVESLQATTSCKFDKRIRRTDGNINFSYSEEIDAKAGPDGSLSIPSEIQIAIPIYTFGERHAILARLRYRFNRGSVTFILQLANLQETVERAFETRVAELRDELTPVCPVYYGPAPRSSTPE